MAAIDKIYVDSLEEYELFKDWCAKQPIIEDKYGKKVSLLNYVFKYDEWKESKCYPVCNNPYYIDAYLIRNCPLDFIQKELMLNYGKWTQDQIDEAYKVVMERGGGRTESGIYHWLSKEDFQVIDGKVYFDQSNSAYDQIKRGELYANPTTKKEYKIGKSYKVLQHPNPQYNRPFKMKRWDVSVDTPFKLGYMWYHGNTNTWDFSDEFVISDWHSSWCCRYKTIKAVKKAILKWKLPVGTIVTCTGRYLEDTYKFEII